MPQVDVCFTCWPGGPVTPPPCLKCGSRQDYFAAGRCIRCHPRGNPGPDSCLDCLAWGALRHNKWLCLGCRNWRATYAQPSRGGGIGPCPGCGRTLTLGARGYCRLCHKHATYAREPGQPWDPVAANKHGQQLFFAYVFYPRRRPPGDARTTDPPTPVAQPAPTAQPHWLIPREEQAAFFPATPDLARHGRTGLYLRAHPDDVAPLEAVARELAATHQWSNRQSRDANIGLRIMLGIQHDGRAPIRASQVEALHDIDLPVWSVLEILSTAGALINDRPPRIETWFHERVDPLPQPMADELTVWFDIKTNGSATPPRAKPRSDITIRLHLAWALTTLHAWAAAGHTSLREISRDDIQAALPSDPRERARTGQGLKSIFRTLKARKIIFVDPTAHIRTGEHPRRQPLPLHIGLIADRLNSENPATAAIVALIAFQGLRLHHLQQLRLTDIRDGTLHLEGRTIPLADPARQLVTAYLDHRNHTWPTSTSTYLFINARTRRRDQPAGNRWFHLAIGPGLTARQLRDDRILDEADATGGDPRTLADLFGLSINAATRYLPTIEAADLTPDH